MIVETPTTNNLSPSDLTGLVNSGSSNNIIGSANGFGGILSGIDGNIIGIEVSTILNTTLTNNGGPTQTLALLPGSPAIDAALTAKCAVTDQRGEARPQGAGCDIGAFEVFVPTADLAVTGTVTPNPVMALDGLITWSITVSNKGTANASGVKLVDTLPTSGLTSLSVTASQGGCGLPVSGVISCTLGSIANSGSATVTLKGIATTAGTLTNQVKVSGDQADNTLANNTATQTNTVQALLCNGLKPTIVGSLGADTIRGTKGRDIIHGLGGNDTITAGNDNDIICGGDGNDLLKGESGNDTLDGGAGTDNCDGGSGTDTAANCEVKTSIP